jgi:hypothetical protein
VNLNRWQRIGVVISVLWILGSSIHVRNSQVESAIDSVTRIHQMCMDAEGVQSKNCSEQFEKNHTIFLKPNWTDVAFTAFVPVLLGWFLILIIIRVYRWIKAGEA